MLPRRAATLVFPVLCSAVGVTRIRSTARKDFGIACFGDMTVEVEFTGLRAPSVKPEWAATVRERLKRVGSSTPDLNVNAVT